MDSSSLRRCKCYKKQDLAIIHWEKTQDANYSLTYILSVCCAIRTITTTTTANAECWFTRLKNDFAFDSSRVREKQENNRNCLALFTHAIIFLGSGGFGLACVDCCLRQIMNFHPWNGMEWLRSCCLLKVFHNSDCLQVKSYDCISFNEGRLMDRSLLSIVNWKRSSRCIA